MLCVRERCGERDKHMRREMLCVRERCGERDVMCERKMW